MIRWLCILALAVIMGCTSDEVAPKPTGTMKLDSVAMVLSEVHIFNAEHQHRYVRQNGLQPFVQAEHLQLYDSLGIDETQFQSSLKYYQNDEDSLEKLYEKTLSILSTQLAEVTATKEGAQKLSAEKDTAISAAEEMRKTHLKMFGKKIPKEAEKKLKP